MTIVIGFEDIDRCEIPHVNEFRYDRTEQKVSDYTIRPT